MFWVGLLACLVVSCLVAVAVTVVVCCVLCVEVCSWAFKLLNFLLEREGREGSCKKRLGIGIRK